MAESLRTDQHCIRRLALAPAFLVRLRELSRTEDTLGSDLRRAANQLYQLLLRYYPQTLQLCSYPDEPWLWTLLETAATPDRGQKLTIARIRALLAKHHIRRYTAEEVRDVLCQPSLPVAPSVAEAVSERVLLMLPQLRLLHRQRKDVGERVEVLLLSLTAGQPNGTRPRDYAVDPGRRPWHLRDPSGRNLPSDSTPRLLWSASAWGNSADHATERQGLQVIMRYGRNQRLDNALYYWALKSLQVDERSKDQYARLRGAGHGHGRALRGVADRRLAMLIAMLKSGRTYDPSLRGQLANSRPAA